LIPLPNPALDTIWFILGTSVSPWSRVLSGFLIIHESSLSRNGHIFPSFYTWFFSPVLIVPSALVDALMLLCVFFFVFFFDSSFFSRTLLTAIV
jgi:hypothetical protein